MFFEITYIRPHLYFVCSETEPDWEEDIRDEVLEECSKYGPVVHISVDSDSQGHVYVKFESLDGARKVSQCSRGDYLVGWWLSNRKGGNRSS